LHRKRIDCTADDARPSKGKKKKAATEKKTPKKKKTPLIEEEAEEGCSCLLAVLKSFY